MTLADQAGITGHDGQVTSGNTNRPKRRTFTAAYKARILAAFDALPEGSPARGELLRRERLYHSRLEHWRAQQENGTLPATAGTRVTPPSVYPHCWLSGLVSSPRLSCPSQTMGPGSAGPTRRPAGPLRRSHGIQAATR